MQHFVHTMYLIDLSLITSMRTAVLMTLIIALCLQGHHGLSPDSVGDCSWCIFNLCCCLTWQAVLLWIVCAALKMRWYIYMRAAFFHPHSCIYRLMMHYKSHWCKEWCYRICSWGWLAYQDIPCIWNLSMWDQGQWDLYNLPLDSLCFLPSWSLHTLNSTQLLQ